MFNIIDTTRGEKADLIPLTTTPWYGHALRRRVRQQLDMPNSVTLDVRRARADDVIIGKLMALKDGRSRKHELDIQDMLVAHYLNPGPSQLAFLDDKYVTSAARAMGDDVMKLWVGLVDEAHRVIEQAGQW